MPEATHLRGEVYVEHARAARARMRIAREGSPEWLEAKKDELRAIAALQREFGVVDVETVDWLIEHARSK